MKPKVISDIDKTIKQLESERLTLLKDLNLCSQCYAPASEFFGDHPMCSKCMDEIAKGYCGGGW